MSKAPWLKGKNGKMPKTYAGKSTKLGGGGRFAALTAKIQKSNPGYSKEGAKAAAAAIGRAKHGKKTMAHIASLGKKRASKKK